MKEISIPTNLVQNIQEPAVLIMNGYDMFPLCSPGDILVIGRNVDIFDGIRHVCVLKTPEDEYAVRYITMLPNDKLMIGAASTDIPTETMTLEQFTDNGFRIFANVELVVRELERRKTA